MRSLIFEGKTWLIYEEIRSRDRQLHRPLCRIIKELTRDDPASGLGKPERLKHDLSGFWSRRISKKDRIIYKFDDHYVYIFSLGGHYDQVTPQSGTSIE